MFVVLDSTVLVGDYKLRSIHTQALLEESRGGRHRVAIPELVFLETTSKWRVQTEAVLKRTAMDADRLGLESVTANLPPLADAADEYSSWLREHLNDQKVQWIDIPEVGHKTLALWAVERRKPFADKGTGYRDALIWESVKSLARDCGGEVLLVSQNTSDFAGPEEQLHPDLVRDLSESGLEQSQVRFVKNCAIAVERIVTPARAALDWFRERLERDTGYREHVQGTIVANLDQSLQLADQSLGRDAAAQLIERIHTPVDSYEVLNAWVIGDNRIGVEMEIEAEADVSVYVKRAAASDMVTPTEDAWLSRSGRVLESKTVKALIMAQLRLPMQGGDEIYGAYACAVSLF